MNEMNVLRSFSILSIPYEISLTEALALVVWIYFVSEIKESFSALSSILVAVQ
jgi:hypothetical protein